MLLTTVGLDGCGSLAVPLETSRTHLLQLQPGESMKRLDWHSWGPRGSRFIHIDRQPFAYRQTERVFGTRYTTHVRVGLEGKVALAVYDFNQLAARKAAGELRGSALLDEGVGGGLVGRIEVFDEPNTVSSNLFREPVATQLP